MAVLDSFQGAFMLRTADRVSCHIRTSTFSIPTGLLVSRSEYTYELIARIPRCVLRRRCNGQKTIHTPMVEFKDIVCYRCHCSLACSTLYVEAKLFMPSFALDTPFYPLTKSPQYCRPTDSPESISSSIQGNLPVALSSDFLSTCPQTLNTQLQL